MKRDRIRRSEREYARMELSADALRDRDVMVVACDISPALTITEYRARRRRARRRSRGRVGALAGLPGRLRLR